jgi:uncharacterized membrane protein YdjX (TVP38/TMEM64 family)
LRSGNAWMGRNLKETSEGAAGIRRSSVIGGAALLVILLGAIAAFFLAGGDLTPIVEMGLSAEQIAETIRSWGAWAVIGSVLLMVLHSLVPLPSEFIAIANGIVFGFVVGAVITWIGAMLGAILAFALSRWFGRRFVQAILPARYTAAIDEWTKEQGMQALLISRLLPVVSFNLINYAAGLTTVSWWTFLWTTGLGILPLTFLMVYAGEQMMSGRWKVVLYLIAAGAAVSLLAYVIARKRKTTKKR